MHALGQTHFNVQWASGCSVLPVLVSGLTELAKTREADDPDTGGEVFKFMGPPSGVG